MIKKRLNLRDPFPWACWRPTPWGCAVGPRAGARAPRLPAGSRTSGGTAIERQLPGTRPAQSVQGTCLPAWGLRAQEGPGKGSSSSRRVSQRCRGIRARSLSQKESRAAPFRLYYLCRRFLMSQTLRTSILIEQPALGMLTISTFPLCLLPGDYIRHVIIILARVKAREKKKQNKTWFKEKIRTWAGSNADISFWRSSYFYFYLWNPANILKGHTWFLV